MRWVRRGVAGAALVIGWLFIAWKNGFHVTAPMVFVCLGYLAVIATIYNLWRTGAAAVDHEDDCDSTRAKPVGAVGELEREKRTLLKAIKEAEFDLQMGKLSQRDADDMIRGYRARAIEVIKEIDRLGLGAAGTVREQILREVRARIQLEGKAPKKADKAAGKVVGNDARETKRAAKAAEHAAEAKAAAEDKTADRADAAAAKADAATDSADAAADRAASDAAPTSENRPRDEDLDADSTTALEPRRDDPAKEATP
jgi:hypothetical protein